MGTKKGLAEEIAKVVHTLPHGPFLDLFAGIAVVAKGLGDSRPVWCNDVQTFPQTLCRALYTSRQECRPQAEVISRVRQLGDRNLNTLLSVLKQAYDLEMQATFGGDRDEQVLIQSRVRVFTKEARETLLESGAYHLFTATYAGSFLGLTQSMQLDSIRYGADQALQEGSISADEHDRCLVSLCRAIQGLCNSTGHFAQYLKPRTANISRVISKRRRCAWEHFRAAYEEMGPSGSRYWRETNRVFGSDANDLLLSLQENVLVPKVIYADPPYTDDQYSRFYHLWETAILYDYPEVSGVGLYRPDRFRSSFSLKSGVENAFCMLVERAACLGATLVVSYPSNGLLKDARTSIPDILRTHFRNVRRPVVYPSTHSTMGASKGRQKEIVEECLFVAS